MTRCALFLVLTLSLQPALHNRPDGPATSISARIASARDGDVIEIGPGTYREHLRIDKAVRLVGRDQPVIDGGGDGDIVEITAEGAEFSGFVVRDTGIDLDRENCGIRVLAPRVTITDNVLEDILFGIDLKSASDSVVRGNKIGGKLLDIARRGDGLRLWRSDRVVIEDNEIHDGRDAILWYSKGVVVRGNRSFRCRYGFHLMYSDGVTIDENELSDNSVGVYLMYSKEIKLRRNRITRNRGPSGYGIGLKETDRFVIDENLVAGNRVGIYLDGSPFGAKEPSVIEGNTFAYNDVGMAILPSVRGNVVTGNNFIDNFEQVSVQGRGELRGNTFSRGDRGNYWSDYVGYDEDRDGIGDYEYASQTLFENMLDREPKLRVFLLGPAQQAVEFVQRALPAVRPEAKFTDPAPLMAPEIRHAAVSSSQPSGGSLIVVGSVLGALGAAILAMSATGAGLSRGDQARDSGEERRS
ncbi:MAG: nitrous oxide reductase family maturation protein NosD [Phycisphaerae bacterium]|nr:nitrous oxide reductase family maturation protein NosD [Phycisphaerae bacterium]